MAPAGLIRREELPPFWGLLDETPRVVVEAPVKQVADATTRGGKGTVRESGEGMRGWDLARE